MPPGTLNETACGASLPAHTPGPWVAERGGSVGFHAPVIAFRPGSHVAWLTRGLPGGGWPDAHLISAAPDLLEALQWAVQFIDDDAQLPLEACRAAIAKALGTSPASPADAQSKAPEAI